MNEFIDALWSLISYIKNDKRTPENEKLEHLAFCILNLMDGMSGEGLPPIEKLLKKEKVAQMWHEFFYERKPKR